MQENIKQLSLATKFALLISGLVLVPLLAVLLSVVIIFSLPWLCIGLSIYLSHERKMMAFEVDGEAKDKPRKQDKQFNSHLKSVFNGLE